MSRKKSGEYPFDDLLDVDAFEYAADKLKLCRQQRRVTYGRVAHFTVKEIAQRLRLSEGTVKSHDAIARGLARR